VDRRRREARVIGAPLFDARLPQGFRYQPGFLSPQDEVRLAGELGGIAFSDFTMRGYVARRRVAFFGRTYDAGDENVQPMPPFLLALRDRVGEWAHVDPDRFVMALANEYRPGTPIGWHRDAPQYDVVAGVSLLSACRMKFRPYVPVQARGAAAPKRVATHEIVLEPRSVYLLADEARNSYEHHIPAVAALRYSVTFRTVR
jgi:alkylated DNA repair dioxygenase AlkB